jgi:2-polyprenyl-3-methyl-5-hydroxy-6-metoxy-1,4-benzoquinol methylase
MDAAILSHFDRAAASYDAKSSAVLWRWLRRREFAAVYKTLEKAPKSLRVLDLGCGSGFYLENLRERGFNDLTGVDASPKMIACLRGKNFAGVVGDIEVVSAEAVKQPTILAPSPFDVIICAGALEFVASAQNVFNNAALMLAPTGRFIILYPRKNYFGQFYSRYHRQHGGTIRLFDADEIATMAKTSRLTLEAQENVFPFAGVASLRKDAL